MKETGLDYYARFMDGETEIQKEEREGDPGSWIQAMQDPDGGSGDGVCLATRIL